MSWFPGIVLRYFVDDFETDEVSPIIIGITFVFTIHVQCISIVRAPYFKILLL